jgi:hypothetical protein
MKSETYRLLVLIGIAAGALYDGLNDVYEAGRGDCASRRP